MKLGPSTLISVVALLGLFACGKGSSNQTPSSVIPTITSQPSSQTVTVGQSATFTVAATGTAPLSYQWQNAVANENIPGAISASYTTPAATQANNGSTFRVIVTNSAGNATSNTVTLTVSPAPVAPSITSQPVGVTVTVGQTATFSVTATGTAPLSYQWQKNGANISGAANSPNYTTPAAAIGDSGATFQVIVSNGVNPPATSSAATLAVSAPQPSTVTVLTYHNDNGRTGLNPNEAILTTSNVNSASFGLMGSVSVDGLVDAEPLYAGNLTVNGAVHNVLFVATENDSVYAFDADTFAQLWHVSTLGAGEVASDSLGCNQVVPTIGITSTPVIDLGFGAHGAIFVVAMSKAGGGYHQRLHALDLTTGADLATPTDIQATAQGMGTGNVGGIQTFNPASYEERAALLLLNGAIYTAWTSHCDAANYTSWVMSFSESTLQEMSVLNLTANGTTQNGQEGGIWMSGSGPAADSSGNIYFLVGNGTFDTTLNGSGFPNLGDYGNSFMKLSTAGNALAVSDYFTMHNTCCIPRVSESNTDTDLGSGGAMLLPDLTDGQGNIRHLAVGAGKDSTIYVVDRDNMGKFNSNNDNAIYQELSGVLDGGVWAAPAYFNSTIYYGGVDDNLKAVAISNARLAAASSSAGTFGYPGTTPSISANGSANGIVWAIANSTSPGTGTLHAYDASDLDNELFNGTFATNSNDKFVTPMIANGKVYVGTPGAVVIFGLLNQSARLSRKPNPAREHRRSLQSPRAPRPGSSTPGH